MKLVWLHEYGRVVWTPDDVRSIRPDWDFAKAEEWLVKNEHHIKNRLVELGWDVLTDLTLGEE